MTVFRKPLISWGWVTSIDEGWAVVQSAKMWSRQRKKRVQSAEITLKPGPRQHRAHDQISQRMTHKTEKNNMVILSS